MAQNCPIFDFALDEDDFSGIVALGQKGSSFSDHRATWMLKRLGGHKL